MSREAVITLVRPSTDIAFPEQDDQEIERINHFKQIGDLIGFFVEDSNDGLTRTIRYVISDDKIKIVMLDPVIVAIREELQAICYENQISYNMTPNKGEIYTL